MGLGAAASTHRAPSSDEEEDKEDAYQRIRQELMGDKSGRAIGDAPQQLSDRTTGPVLAGERAPPPSSSNTDSPKPRHMPSRPTSPAVSRQETPGIFISPAKPQNAEHAASDSDSEDDLPPNYRLKEIVERKRQERLQREAEQIAKEEARRERAMQIGNVFEDDDEVDRAVEKKLTQQARPTRKASKKAIEEMNRETQRMARNQQLTHQAKVKKRFTTQDFLRKFGKASPQPSTLSTVVTAGSAPNTSSVAGSSDAEDNRAQDTPPSSPPSIEGSDLKEGPTTAAHAVDEPLDNKDASDDELPSMEETLSQPLVKKDKGKSPIYPTAAPVEVRSARTSIPRQIRVLPPPKPADLGDSDDDLEIVTDRFGMFDQVPERKAMESKSLHALRRLAQVGAVEKTGSRKNARPSMTPAELEIELRRRAKLQAQQERAEKIALLKARGYDVLTDEQREQEQLQIENALEKAREDADKLRKMEREEAKKNGTLREEDMLASDDESEDEYVASDEEEEDEEQAELDMSGSEDEEEEQVQHGQDLLDDVAEEGSDEEEEVIQGQPALGEKGAGAVSNDDATAGPVLSRRLNRKKRIIDDEDDEPTLSPSQEASQPRGSLANDDIAAAFGFGPAPAAPMGISQMFAGTMEASQGSATDRYSQEQDSMDIFRDLPSAPMPTFDPVATEESQDALIKDSQTSASQTQQPSQHINLVQSPAVQSPAMSRITQFSPMPDPSQDVGLGLSRTPAGIMAPPSTVDTVMMDVPESPIVQRKGRLVRREAVAETADDASGLLPTQDLPPTAGPSNVFDVMRKAAAKPDIPFDKKKSNAKDMVDEQAEESEDEYAGLGGADGDVSDDEADEEDRKMIDESHIDVNERELAAFAAYVQTMLNPKYKTVLTHHIVTQPVQRMRPTPPNCIRISSLEPFAGNAWEPLTLIRTKMSK